LIFYKIFHLCNLVFFLFNKFFCVNFYYKFYVFFYYKFILMQKFIKHNKVNYSYCNVKYFDLHLSLKFFYRISLLYWYFILRLYFFFIMYLNKKIWKTNYNPIEVHNLVYKFCVLALVSWFIGLISSLISRICIFGF